MNYRALFLISFIILTVAIVGLLFISSDAEEGAPNESEPVVERVVAKPVDDKSMSITEVVAKRDLYKGEILQPEDFEVIDREVPQSNKGYATDLTAVLSGTRDRSLQGFLMARSVVAGKPLLELDVISPEDDRFVRKSVNPKEEVAYSLCVQGSEQYLLDTLDVGSAVDIYQRSQRDQLAAELNKLAGNLDVLQIKRLEVSESSGNDSTKSCVAYVRLKMNLAQARTVYQAMGDKILLPAQETLPLEKHGTSIRSLRGN